MLALDLPNARAAEAMVAATSGVVDGFKVGLRLFVAEGPRFVRALAREHFVFLDLKFHDIPNTVAEAVEAAARLGVHVVNVHAQGGEAMMRRAAEAAQGSGVRVVAVTALTSAAMPPQEAERVVLGYAEAARKAGLHGVVCSAREAAAVRRFWPDGYIITPSIRLPQDAFDDQARVATPQEAARAGVDWIVVGR
ncbi:MAG: orotidine-5'-phosphate decarboxylase, partial [Zetaproteobacteria bacterium]